MKFSPLRTSALYILTSEFSCFSFHSFRELHSSCPLLLFSDSTALKTQEANLGPCACANLGIFPSSVYRAAEKILYEDYFATMVAREVLWALTYLHLQSEEKKNR